jgi:stringent starvation protein B
MAVYCREDVVGMLFEGQDSEDEFDGYISDDELHSIMKGKSSEDRAETEPGIYFTFN